MKIALIGPYPPPYGGISIHLQRLDALLRRNGYNVMTYRNISARRWLFFNFGRWKHYNILHFQDIDWLNRFFIGLLGALNAPTILTIHGDSLKLQLRTLKPLQSYLLRFGLRHIRHIIVVNPEFRDLLLSIGVDVSRITAINAYLPPVIDPGDNEAIPAWLQTFLEIHQPLLVANGFEVIPYGEADLYGINLSIELCCCLIKEYPGLGFLFFLARQGDLQVFERYLDQIKEKGLRNHFQFVIGQPFLPVLSQADLFIRPTYQDGYGISIPEAMHFGVPAIASDVCPRARGTFLFKTGDIQDLILIVRNVFTNISQAQKQAIENRMPDNFTALLEIYQKVAAQKGISFKSYIKSIGK
jgi:glycosyltransferase involved in cell wall biosynthesis